MTGFLLTMSFRIIGQLACGLHSTLGFRKTKEDFRTLVSLEKDLRRDMGPVS